MASISVCPSCLRAMRQWSQAGIRSPRTAIFAQRALFTTSPHSRANAAPKTPPQAATPPAPPAPKQFNATGSPPTGPITNLASQLRNNPSLRSATEPYIAYGGTEELYQECSRQCSYTVPAALTNPRTSPPQTAAGEDLGEGSGWWLEPKAKGGLGLDVTFNTWAQVVFLHMWIMTVRLRCFPAKHVRNWHQHLLDHFFFAAEDRMATWHGLVARSARNKYLKDLWTQWRGVLLSYDEGLIKGDAVMAAAIWRNVFKGDKDVDVADLALVTAYVMKQLQTLGALDDTTMVEGRVKFSDPKEVQREISLRQSPWMRTKFSVDEMKDPEELAQKSA